ncbi:hypothetical protein L3Q82_026152, partial [Scortum barcoo]
SGVGLHPVVQVRSECSASLSGHLRDLCRNESAVELRQRCPPAASPPRRLRFEDETETEAESRYLERQWQRRGVGQRGTGVLVSKPDMNLFVNCRTGAGLQGGGNGVNRQQRGRMPAGGAGQCDSCGTVLESGLNLNLHLHPPVPENQGRSLYRTEPIKETYIGSVTPGEVSKRGGGAWHYTNKQDDEVMKKTFQVKFNGNQVTLPQATPTTDLPINPYAPDQLTTPIHPSPLVPPSSSCPPHVTSVMTSQRTKLNQNQGGAAAAKPHRKLRPRAALKERSHCVKDGGLDLWMKGSSSSSSSEITAESHTPSTTDSRSDGQVRQPMRGEPHSDVSLPEHFINRDDSFHLSLRRLFSTIRLSRTRTGSLDRLSSQPRPPVSDPPTPSSLRKSSGLLKKTLSVQSLSVQGSPFLQLRKSSSIYSFGSEQKKKKDRSADYKPAADQFLQRCLSIEDVGHPCSVRSVGRVLQVCSDGTFLLELRRPKSEMFGFIVSRGRGRSDSGTVNTLKTSQDPLYGSPVEAAEDPGVHVDPARSLQRKKSCCLADFVICDKVSVMSPGVYVEDMVDSSTEKLYAGLLGVGDEILEVNGEKVACLTLDEVTHLLTQNTSATIRVLRHRRTPPQ